MERRYLYHISYFHSTGIGSSQILFKNKIGNIEDFNNMVSTIEKENKLNNVVIISYQLIGKHYIRSDNNAE